jgi:hypothetical protein
MLLSGTDKRPPATARLKPSPSAARLIFRLVLASIAETQRAAATHDLRASRRRWIRAGSAISALGALERGREWALRACEQCLSRFGAGLADRWEVVLDRWARVGQSEELAGRQLLRDLATGAIERAIKEITTRPELYDVVDEVLGHLANRPPQLTRLVNEITQSLIHDPDVRALIHEQSTSLLGSAVESVRDETARADTALERAFATLERRLRRR